MMHGMDLGLLLNYIYFPSFRSDTDNSFASFFLSADFSNLIFSKNYFSNTIRVSNKIRHRSDQLQAV